MDHWLNIWQCCQNRSENRKIIRFHNFALPQRSTMTLESLFHWIEWNRWENCRNREIALTQASLRWPISPVLNVFVFGFFDPVCDGESLDSPFRQLPYHHPYFLISKVLNKYEKEENLGLFCCLPKEWRWLFWSDFYYLDGGLGLESRDWFTLGLSLVLGPCGRIIKWAIFFNGKRAKSLKKRDSNRFIKK